MIKFGEWLPDQEALDNRGSTEAKNVIPSLTGYRCFKELSAYSGAADTKIRGMFAAKDDSGNGAIYVGDTSKLYRLNASTSALDDKSKSGGYTTTDDESWRFVQFGETVLATNFDDPIQTSTAASGSAFADLTGSPPKAKYMTVVRDQVMLGHTNDTTDGIKPYRLWWSGLNDQTSWTPGTNLSDYQDVVDVGSLNGLTGGEFAIALFEKAIVRGSFVGNPLIYQFDKLTTSRGCSVPGSVASVGSSLVFFLDTDGFFMLSGDQIKAIGNQKVDKWFYDRFQAGSAKNMCAGIDPRNQMVIWSYPNIDSTDGENNEILIYNYSLDRWSYSTEFATSIMELFTAGYTLEELANISSSVETLPASLDDPIYQGGLYFFAGAKDKKIQSFSGNCLDARIETAEFQIAPGRRSLVNTVIPYVSADSGFFPTVQASIGSRNRQLDVPTFTSGSSITDDGYCPVRSMGTHHRVRLDLTGEWSQAQGVDIDAKQVGLR